MLNASPSFSLCAMDAYLIERNLRKKFLQFETYARIIDSYGERTDIESSMQIFNAAEAALLIKLKA